VVARADRTPGHQVAEILRADRIERLCAGGKSQFVDVAQHLAGQLQAFLDMKESFMRGSLIRPFQPVVVRGFSK